MHPDQMTPLHPRDGQLEGKRVHENRIESAFAEQINGSLPPMTDCTPSPGNPVVYRADEGQV